MEQETTTTLPNSKLVYTQEGKVLEEKPKIFPLEVEGSGDFFFSFVLPWIAILSVVLIPVIPFVIPRIIKAKTTPLILKMFFIPFYLLMVIVFFWAMFEHFI